MNIDKHTIIKESGVLTYSEITPIYKNRTGFCLDDRGFCGQDIIFNSPLEIKWKYSEISILDETTIIKKVDLEYDFGMICEFFPYQRILENREYWKYRDVDLDSPILDIIKRYIEDQIIFSLLRNPCELTPVHWALRGWLRDRSTIPWHNQLIKL